MGRGKVAVLLLTILVLNLGVPACGSPSQGTREQQRPAENQSSGQEDAEEVALENPAPTMEETANEEQTTK